MNFHPDKQLLQVAGAGDQTNDPWISKPALYLYTMGNPLVWILMKKRIITFVQILTKSNIRGKSCEILWGLKFTYLEKFDLLSFEFELINFFNLLWLALLFLFHTLVSTRFSELNPLTLEWCGIYFLNIDLESLVCW